MNSDRKHQQRGSIAESALQNETVSTERRTLLKAGWIVPVILVAHHLVDGVALHATTRPPKGSTF
jgi:hypothetical protein